MEIVLVLLFNLFVLALYDGTQHGCSFLVFSLTQKRKLALNIDDPTGTDLVNTDR